MIIAASIVTGLLMAAVLFRVFFDDLSDFLECVGYWFTPDIISLFRGEWAEDQWAEAKLFLYLGLSFGVGALTYCGMGKLLG